MQVAVCGPGTCTDEEARAAFAVGRGLAKHGATVLCGGGPGVMASAAAGARSSNGRVVLIQPGAATGELGSPTDVVIATNLGEARNAVLVGSVEAVIAVGGSWGTLSEGALAMRPAADLPPGAVPVVSLGGLQVLDPGRETVARLLTAPDPPHPVAPAPGPAPAARLPASKGRL